MKASSTSAANSERMSLISGSPIFVNVIELPTTWRGYFLDCIC